MFETHKEQRHCDKCDKTMEPQFEGYEQYDNALHLSVHGGYGEFVDSIDGPIKIVLCHECAHTICNNYPWLGALIDPFRSHSHTEEYKQDNPQHWGCDYNYNTGDDSNAL